VEESSTDTGADLASLGAWLERSSFALLYESQTGEEGTVDVRYGIAVGDLTGTPPAGSATWLGIMAGTTVAGDSRGERLVGDAALIYDFPAAGDGSGPSLHVAFDGITNIDRGTAHTVETVIFSNIAVGPDGTFARGQSGARIQGAFHGPGHAEAAGIFEQSDIVGAFGARRQQAPRSGRASPAAGHGGADRWRPQPDAAGKVTLCSGRVTDSRTSASSTAAGLAQETAGGVDASAGACARRGAGAGGGGSRQRRCGRDGRHQMSLRPFINQTHTIIHAIDTHNRY